MAEKRANMIAQWWENNDGHDEWRNGAKMRQKMDLVQRTWGSPAKNVAARESV